MFLVDKRWFSMVAGCTFFASSSMAFVNNEPNIPPIQLDQLEDMKINASIEYWIDPLKDHEILDIISLEEGWSIPLSDNEMLPLESTRSWVRFRVSNPKSETQVAYVELNPVFLERIHIFDEEGKLLDQTGSILPWARTEAFPTVQLSVASGVHWFYMAIESRSSAISLVMRSETAQHKKAQVDIAVFCLLLGGLFSLLIYHFFLFVAYRHRNYILYVGFVAAMIFFTVAFTSFHRLILPNEIAGFEIGFWWSAISAPVFTFCIYLFSANLLDLLPTKNRALPFQRLRYGLLVLPIMDIFCFSFILISNDPIALVPIRINPLIHLIALAGVGVYLWIKNRGNVVALYYTLSWIPFCVGAFLVVAWLSGIVDHHSLYTWSLPLGTLVQSVLLSFAAGQQLNVLTRDKMQEQQDKLRVMGELEVYAKHLEKRDKVITSFVSSEILTELDKGEDPLAYQPRNVNKCIVFLDMRDYTTLTESSTPIDCYEVLNEYFSVINSTTYRGSGTVDKIIGDAMMVVFDDPTQCLKTIVALRRNLSEKNRSRVSAQLKPIKFGVGISFGTMLSANFGNSHKFDRSLVGDTVNVASRLESITKQFATDVLCSKEFMDLHPDYPFSRPAGYLLLKGKSKKSLVFEIFEHNLPEVVAWKQHTKPYLLETIQLELDGRYHEALSVLAKLIAKCPPHSYKKGAIMDQSLLAMVEAIQVKMRQLGLPVQGSSVVSMDLGTVQLGRVS